MINLDKENISKIEYNDIIAIFIAEGGAMGEPNVFHVVLKDLTHYYTNLENANFTKEEFYKTFPVMKTFNCFFENVSGLDDGWKWFNAGMGNYLIVRSEYYERINKTIIENLSEDYQYGKLFQQWYKMIEKSIN